MRVPPEPKVGHQLRVLSREDARGKNDGTRTFGTSKGRRGIRNSRWAHGNGWNGLRWACGKAGEEVDDVPGRD